MRATPSRSSLSVPPPSPARGSVSSHSAQDLRRELHGVLGRVPQHSEVVGDEESEQFVYGRFQTAARSARVLSSVRRSNTFQQIRKQQGHAASGHDAASSHPSAEDLNRLLSSSRSHIQGPSRPSSMAGPPPSHQRWLEFMLTPSAAHTGIFLILSGAVGGTLLFFVDYVIAEIEKVRQDFIQFSDVTFFQMLLHFAFACVLSLIAAFVVQHIGPGAAGSGIPEMKSLLSGVHLPTYLHTRTLIAKVVGLILAAGSGLFIGKEGPFVHIACATTEQLMRFKVFRYLKSSKVLYHQMLAAACAVGVASTFGAPVGGVLFSIEVTATYFLTSNYAKCFLAAVSGAVWMRVCSSTMGKSSEFSSLFFTDFGRVPFDRAELVVFAVLGALCGLVGSAFVGLVRRIVLFRRAHPEYLGKSRYRYTMVVCLATSLLLFPVGEFPRLGVQPSIHDLFLNEPLSSSQANASDWTRSPGLVFNLILFIFLKLTITAFSVTLPIPAGVFTPVFVMGAAIGRLVGEGMSSLFPHGVGSASDSVLAGGYAVVGAAAMATGVTRTISTALIVFELTGELHHLIPALVAVLAALAVSDLFNVSIYETVLQLRSLPFLRPPTNPANYMLMAAQVMQQDYPFVYNNITTQQLAVILKSWGSTQMFPLVESEDTMLLVGSVRRTALEYMLRHQVVQCVVGERLRDRNDEGQRMLRVLEKAQEEGAEVDFAHMAQSPALSNETKLLLSSVAPSANDELDEDDPDPMGNIAHNPAPTEGSEGGAKATSATSRGAKNDSIVERVLSMGIQSTINFHSPDFAWMIDASPYQVVEETPLAKVYHMLMMLSLDIVYVTRVGALVGIITTEHLLAQQL